MHKNLELAARCIVGSGSLIKWFPVRSKAGVVIKVFGHTPILTAHTRPLKCFLTLLQTNYQQQKPNLTVCFWNQTLFAHQIISGLHRYIWCPNNLVIGGLVAIIVP